MTAAVEGGRRDPDVVDRDGGAGAAQFGEDPSIAAGDRRGGVEDGDKGLVQKLGERQAVLLGPSEPDVRYGTMRPSELSGRIECRCPRS